MARIARPTWLNLLAESLRTELAVASIRSLALNLGYKLLVLSASIVLARLLGAEGFGIYASSIAAALLLGAFAQLGLPTLVTRALPAYEVKRQWGLMRGLMRQTNKFVFSFSLLLAAVAGFVAWSMGDRVTDIQRIAFLWAFALVPVASLNILNAATLRGLRHVVAGQLSEALVIPGLFAALIVAWWYFGDGLTLASLSPDVAVAIRLAVTVIGLAVGMRLLLGRIPTEARRAEPEYDSRNWLRAALPLLFLAGAAAITTQTDVLMLAALQSNASAGVYQAAARGAELVAFSLFVVNAVVQPTISRLHTLDDRRRLQTVVTAAARLALVLALPVALVLAFFAQPILQIVYGTEFDRGALCLVILCAAQVINVSAGLVDQILIMTGHVRDAAEGLTVGAIVNVVLNAILIPIWEIEGAALATGISLIVWNVFLAVRVRSRTGLASSILGARSRRTPSQ